MPVPNRCVGNDASHNWHCRSEARGSCRFTRFRYAERARTALAACLVSPSISSICDRFVRIRSFANSLRLSHDARTRKGLRGKLGRDSSLPLRHSIFVLPSVFGGRGQCQAREGYATRSAAAGKRTFVRRPTMTAVGDFLAKDAEVFLAAQEAAAASGRGRITEGNIFHLAMTSWFT